MSGRPFRTTLNDCKFNNVFLRWSSPPETCCHDIYVNIGLVCGSEHLVMCQVLFWGIWGI
jgi:hypothetical protein